MLVELFLVPGFGVSGVLSLLSMIAAIVISYLEHSFLIGCVVVGVSLLSIGVVVCYGLKYGTWKKVSLQETITATVNDSTFEGVSVGDLARTISRLAPMGKVQVGNRQFEAKSIDCYIDERTEVVVVELCDSYLIVKQKDNN